MFVQDFPVFRENPDLVYLDSGASTQKPSMVIDRVSRYVQTSYANIHRWMYDLSEKSEILFDQSKRKTAAMLNAKFSEIIYTYNATHAANLLAQTLAFSGYLGEGDTVLLGVWDHHATIVPWQLLAKKFGFRIEFIHLNEDLSIDWEDFNQKYNDSVKLVSCSMVSNVTGIIYPMKKLSSLLREDTFFFVDASQAVPHFSVDVVDIDCDALVFTWHKIMAYTGLWVLYMKKERIKKLTPMMWGGGVIDSVSEEGCTLLWGKEKFEAWTPNIIGAVSLLAAWEYIDSIGGYDAIQKHEDTLIAYTDEKFKEYADRVHVFPSFWSSQPRIGVYSFHVNNKNSVDVSEVMADNNIAIRCGGHCAHPLLHSLNQKALCRLSLYLYNTKKDIDAFFSVLWSIV